jgi:pimeloyl-ACP methyl ester carboxylesterase
MMTRDSGWCGSSAGAAGRWRPGGGRRWCCCLRRACYWFTGTAGTAAFVGYANPNWDGQPEPSGVPTAFIQFAHDIGIRPLIEQEHNITRWTDVDHGGHFAATESADELVHDLRAFFHELR